MIIHYIAKCTYFISYGEANSSGNTLKNNVDACMWNVLLEGRTSAHEEAWVCLYLYVLFFS